MLGADAIHCDIQVLSLAVTVKLDSGLTLPHELSKRGDTDQEENSLFLVISDLALGSSHLW